MGEQLGLSRTCPHRTMGASRRHGAAALHFGDSRPVLAALGEVLAVLQKAEPEIAAEQRVAVGIDAVTEVLAGHADL